MVADNLIVFDIFFLRVYINNIFYREIILKCGRRHTVGENVSGHTATSHFQTLLQVVVDIINGVTLHAMDYKPLSHLAHKNCKYNPSFLSPSVTPCLTLKIVETKNGRGQGSQITLQRRTP